MKKLFSLAITLIFSQNISAKNVLIPQDTIRVHRDYALEATMLGYFAKDGTRNPTLKAKKGEWVRITITNGETMTHDIALEKNGTKSKTLLEKGSSTSITFLAMQNDVYYCTIPGHKLAGMVGKFQLITGNEVQKIAKEIAITKNGKKLNLDFEAGNLSDWTATGDAFTDPLISADPSPIHEKDQKIGFEGKYFLSSGGTKNYRPKGTLTSTTFKISQPWASFMVSGGALQDTRVELVNADTKKVIYQTTGQGRVTLQPVVVSLKNYIGKNIFIRIIDNETGVTEIPYVGHDRLAHINFDNFKFYSTRPTFANELNKKDIIIMPPVDPILNSGLSGPEAAKAMTTQAGFTVTLAASEPEVVRPISFTIDPKGRLWVVEGHTYPVPAPEGEGRDRILILEDTDGNGTLDSRKVFMEGLNLVSGIEIGMGGVWLGAAPYLLFIPTNFDTDSPTGPAQKLLDGWGTQDTHEVLNNLRWGPDGWLYGVHGVFTHSNVGKPGAPDSERQKINGGVWRYHPSNHIFEIFAEGASNPWGIDWNDQGQAFITACVIPHMYHIIQGARYFRQAGKHFNPYIYDDIKTIADHTHYVGDRGPHAGNFRSASAGGGHAHAGAMVYLGSGNWPSQYRNSIFMNNINGARLNNDLLTAKGSGYVASHAKDFMVMNDSWSQWLNMRYDASGSVWAIDWYDKNQCHSSNPDVHDKTMGRIYKITYNNEPAKKVNLWAASDLDLVENHLNTNEWYVRNSRTILQNRPKSVAVTQALKNILYNNPNASRQLRALWTLHVTQGLTESEIIDLLTNKNEYIRAFCIQMLAEKKLVTAEALSTFETMANTDPSAVVRLYLASAMQRLNATQRWKVVEALSKKEVDKTDQNIPYLVWYAMEPLASFDAPKALKIAQNAKLPNILNFTVKRIAAIKTADSNKILTDYKTQLAKNHTMANHDLITLIDKELAQ